jgi:uncharacterized membrane protein YhaH (DUF805 family)
MNNFLNAYKNYIDFGSRTTRKEYWMFFLIYVAIYLLLKILGLNLLFIVYLIVSIVPSASITARRLHDVGSSGWWQLIAFIPVIGIVFLLIWLAQEGEGDNIYGTKPKLNGVS